MTNVFLGCNPNETFESASDLPLPLGTRATSGTGEYVLIQAQGAITQYDLCAIVAGYEADPLNTTGAAGKSNACIPQVAIADNHYGWGLVTGKGKVRAAASCAANVALYTTGTAGVVDDTSTSGIISGLVLTEAAPAGGGDMDCIASNLTIAS